MRAGPYIEAAMREAAPVVGLLALMLSTRRPVPRDYLVHAVSRLRKAADLLQAVHDATKEQRP